MRNDAPRPLGRTGRRVSALGFGGYRIDDRTPEHAAALGKALDEGVTLVDTSTNYTDGSSEIAIGNVLASRDRAAATVVSKVGYVQGQALALARDRDRQGRPFPEMVRYMDGCWHCIHPEFLADQLERSRARLRVETIDVYLLHNPEYFFADARKHRPEEPLAALRAAFDDRIRRAFACLEAEVGRGRIGSYGVSSNTFVVPDDDPEATSIERMWAIAGEVAGAHHFTTVQLPANLCEGGAVLTRNNAGGTRTALEFAAERGLAVLVNRPLNAFHRGRLVRLADHGGRDPEVHAVLDPFLPAALRPATLSQKALAVLMNTRGVTSVLNGMRRRSYVDDALGALRGEAFEVDPRLYETFAGL